MGLFSSTANDTTIVTEQATSVGDLALSANRNSSISINGDIGLTGDAAAMFAHTIGNTITDRLTASSLPATPGMATGGSLASGTLKGSKGIIGAISDPKQLMIVALVAVGMLFAFRRK